MTEPRDRAVLEAELLAARARIRELERTVTSLSASLAAIEGDLQRLALSRAWRLGHGISRLSRLVLRRRMSTQGALTRALERAQLVRAANPALARASAAVDEAPLPLAPVHDAASIARAEGPRRDALAREIRARLGAVPARERWPAVSIIVVTHDGHDRLSRLLDGLASTDYPAMDLIVVDNGSARAVEPTIAAGPLPEATVLRNERNEAFAAANNRAAEEAAGEVLLFVNDDVEPFEPGWLKELVSLVLEDGVAVAGATLLHVAQDEGLTASGWIVQHRGIRFRIVDRLARAFNDGDGDDLFGSDFGADRPAPAVTAACMAVRHGSFTTAGGFCTEYRFGTEDVDLCLTLLDSGREVCCSGRSVLFHRESATQSTVSRAAISENRRVNRMVFARRWGARLERELRRARVAGHEYWTPERAHVGITVSSLLQEDGWGDWYTAHELGHALSRLGLHATLVPRKGAGDHPPPDDLDALITLMDTFDLHPLHPSVLVLAWVRNWTHRWTTRPWFGRVDRWLSSSGGSATVLDELAGMPSSSFPLATNADRFRPTQGLANYDYVLTANRWGVERGIEGLIAPRAGERWAVFGKGWEDVPALVEHWRGSVPYDTLPGIYADARVVLDDTAGPTLPYGALNGRVFDALAAGALVVTNCEEGARELFDDDFPVWSDGRDLRATLDRLLGDESLRAELAARYRGVVVSEHTYGRRAERLSELIVEAGAKLSFVIRVAAPDWERAEQWGDLHFARALRQEFTRRGHRCLVQVLSEWEDLQGSAYDVSISLRGLSVYRPKPGQLNVLWSISHPEALTASECDDYDLVAVASPTYARALAGRTRTPVFELEQATDPWRFRPDPDPSLAHDVVFVGNSRLVRRPALDWLLPTDHDVAVWGGNWDGIIDNRYVVAEFVPNEQLRRVYSSAKVVLADHWPDMRAHGYISNRIFDALACGAIVLSDPVAGLAERFGDGVAIYHGPDDLRAQIATLLGDDAQRADRAGRGRDLVLREYTFARRVDELLARVTARRSELGQRDGVLREQEGAGVTTAPPEPDRARRRRP